MKAFGALPLPLSSRGFYAPGFVSLESASFERSEPAGIGFSGSACPVDVASGLARAIGAFGRLAALASDVDGRGHE